MAFERNRCQRGGGNRQGPRCAAGGAGPRWMALHKLWLADKPERRADKKEKDRRQGTVLLDAARYFLQNAHPLNINFVLELPDELRSYFDQWCADAGFTPQP